MLLLLWNFLLTLSLSSFSIHSLRVIISRMSLAWILFSFLSAPSHFISFCVTAATPTTCSYSEPDNKWVYIMSFKSKHLTVLKTPVLVPYRPLYIYVTPIESIMHVLNSLRQGMAPLSCCPRQKIVSYLRLFLFSFSFCLLRATPTAYGDSQTRGWRGAAAVGLRHSHSNAGSKPWLQPTPQLTAMPDS